MNLPGACRALVVEDHDFGREALRRLLHVPGHEAEGAGTIAEAMGRLESVGRLFLDLNLGDGSACTCCGTSASGGCRSASPSPPARRTSGRWTRCAASGPTACSSSRWTSASWSGG